MQGAVAPRFSRTPGEISGPPARAGQHTDEILTQMDRSEADIQQYHAAGVVR
jgi:alpha-methylacyl-CoA racemase